MKSFILALFTTFVTFFSIHVHAQTVVFQDVHLLSMETDRVASNQTVIVEDGVIRWVGPAAEAELPRGAEIISGEYYLMPGLAEMHAHIPSERQGEEYVDQVLKMYVSQGITTIRGMLGEPSHLVLREKAQAREIVSPRIFTSGPSFNGNSATNPEQARQMVRDQKAAGYDLLKLHPGLSRDVFDAMADEAQKQGMEFSGHISYDVGLERTLEGGQGTIDHLDRYMEFMAGEAANRPDPNIIYFGYDLTPHVNESLIDEAARRTVEAGVWNVPTNTLLENVFNPENTVGVMMDWPGVDRMPESVVNGWQNYIANIRLSEDFDEEQALNYLQIRKKLTFALHESGAKLLLGADAPQIFNPPGYSAHRELELLVESGLTPYEALKTGTVNVGEYLEEPDQTGKVAKGYRADLILLSSNPLNSIPFGENIEGVMARGTWYWSGDLD
ncbi:amidohydrolase family protein [Rhodohalobacter halophilus]|uniref:amidohydrolase family protein n=1 Tax=Rhodohalobacter halophilus TaxID=1812810 RepID=UPI00083FD1EC|nr:amidohydrolase family protein [Rhodohalobacter halophilus]